MAAMVRLWKVRLRWLVLRSLGALLLAVCSGVTLVNVAQHLLDFYYVNSAECVEGCYYMPRPIGGWLGTVAIAVIPERPPLPGARRCGHRTIVAEDPTTDGTWFVTVLTVWWAVVSITPTRLR
jgi:hypothetical protein